MKSRIDLVRGWIKKAQSDILAMEASFEAGALDAACFHAQQASEKFLKAFLCHSEIKFPFTHNLSKLLSLCVIKDPSFDQLVEQLEPLTPYAVGLRYDDEFWPDEETTEKAIETAQHAKEFIQSRLPAELRI